MIILGIDPGTANTGYGVIKIYFKKKSKKPKKIKFLECGCIKTNPVDSFPKRLLILSRQVRKIVKIHRPQIVAIENLFFFKNKKTVIKVSEAIGVVVLTLERIKIQSIRYYPLQVKKFLTKNGRAGKEEIQKRVKRILRLKDIQLKDDAADALALAIYAANHIN